MADAKVCYSSPYKGEEMKKVCFIPGGVSYQGTPPRMRDCRSPLQETPTMKNTPTSIFIITKEKTPNLFIDRRRVLFFSKD